MAERSCLVVGGSGHIGGAIAREMAWRGWDVGVHWRTVREAADNVAEDCVEAGVRAFVLQRSPQMVTGSSLAKTSLP